MNEVMETLKQHIAPDASGAAFCDIPLFLGLRRPRLTLDEYLSRFKMVRRLVEARLHNDGIWPEIVLPSLRLHNAALTPNQKSGVLASTSGDPSLEVMKRHMRRILQPMRRGDEARCPLGERRFAQGEPDLVQA